MVRALAVQIGVALDVIELETSAQMFECLAAGGCDVSSLGFDPTRTSQVGGFTPPFMRVDYSHMVHAGSDMRHVDDADRPGARIAAVRDHASTLTLVRALKNAAVVDAATPDDAFELLRTARADAWASIQPTILSYVRRLPGSRMLDGSFGANFPALIVPKGRAARLAYLSEFIERAKASGLIQQAIDRAGQPGYHVAHQGGAT